VACLTRRPDELIFSSVSPLWIRKTALVRAKNLRDSSPVRETDRSRGRRDQPYRLDRDGFASERESLGQASAGIRIVNSQPRSVEIQGCRPLRSGGPLRETQGVRTGLNA